MQEDLKQHGETLAARDAFLAGVAIDFDEHLAMADTDFAIDGLTQVVEVDFV